jgi:hypothetical protein
MNYSFSPKAGTDYRSVLVVTAAYDMSAFFDRLHTFVRRKDHEVTVLVVSDALAKLVAIENRSKVIRP